MRKSAQWVVGSAISVLALALAFRGVQVGEMAEALRTARFIYLVPAIGFIFLGQLARALSWQTILGRQIPYGRVFGVLNIGYLLNNILPFRLGEVGRAYLITRNQNFKTSHALSSVLVERVIDLSIVVIMFAALLPVAAGVPWAREAAFTAVVVSVVALSGLFIVTHNRALALRLFRWGSGLVPLAKRLEPQLLAFLDGMDALHDWRRFALAASASAVAWLCAGLAAWILLFTYAVSAPSLAMGFFVLVISALGVALPSAPASMGVFEASAVAALSAFGVTGAVALTYALTFHAVVLGVTMFLGALALAQEGETLAHLAQSAQGWWANARAADLPPVAVPPAGETTPRPSS